MFVLGIESSCDETAAAVVADGRRVLSNVVYSQIAKHQPFGGVVPELASRCHVEAMPGVLDEALRDAGIAWKDIDLLAVTRGPGLASSLLVGVSAAKALSLSLSRPVVGVNHLEGHVYSVFLRRGDDAPRPEQQCPMLTLLVSGGHTLLVHVEGVGKYRVLGRTVDDAAGEALDKGATLLGLGYPGGPVIEATALNGNPQAVDFPRGSIQGEVRGGIGDLDRRLCFSFSGLKTALLYHLKRNPDATKGSGLADVAASYQEAVFDALIRRVVHALKEGDYRSLACVGGVARNKRLRAKLDATAARFRVPLWLAEPEFCTDNAAMIAGAAGSRPRAGDDLATFDVDPNWRLS